jgi:hypothetical protein
VKREHHPTSITSANLRESASSCLHFAGRLPAPSRRGNKATDKIAARAVSEKPPPKNALANPGRRIFCAYFSPKSYRATAKSTGRKRRGCKRGRESAEACLVPSSSWILINPTRLPEAEQLGWKRALLGARGTLFCLLGSIGCIKHPSLLANPRAPKSGPGGPIFAHGLISISNPGRFQRRATLGLLRKKGDGGAQRETHGRRHHRH